jgi:hypothetical protein
LPLDNGARVAAALLVLVAAATWARIIASDLGAHVLTPTRSRRFLPALKCGRLFAGTKTTWPVLGLRPSRVCWWFRPKLPKPLISMRRPCASAVASASRSALTATSTSVRVNCGCRAASRSIRSERVMGTLYSGVAKVRCTPDPGPQFNRFARRSVVATWTNGRPRSSPFTDTGRPACSRALSPVQADVGRTIRTISRSRPTSTWTSRAGCDRSLGIVSSVSATVLLKKRTGEHSYGVSGPLRGGRHPAPRRAVGRADDRRAPMGISEARMPPQLSA